MVVNENERKAISEIYRHIKKSIKKYFIGNILKRLLELQFKPNHSIKSKYLIRNLKYMFPTIQKHENLFFKWRKVTMTVINKVIAGKSKFSVFGNKKSRFLKQKPNRKQ